RYGIATLTINSKIPIVEDMWKDAVKHIHMQTLMFRLLMVDSGNEKWLCETNQMDPDVKVLDNQSMTEVLDKLFEDGIEQSPLKIRILSAKPDDSCLIPLVKKECPYQYYFMLLFNHGIFDGQSVAMVYFRLLELLGDMQTGKNYMGRMPFGTYTNGVELRDIKTNLKKQLENDPETLQNEKEILESTIKTPLLNEVFSIPESNLASSKYTHYVLEDNIHQSFLQKCKSHAVKISSGVVAAINTAIVEMVKDAGLQKDGYHLSVMQNVDMRRYTKSNPMTTMGFFGGKIHQSYHIDSNIRENFWDHSKEINSRTSELLKKNGPILQEAVRQLTLHPYDANVKRGPAQMEWDYTFNNVLDVTPHLSDPTQLLTVTDVLPINMTHNFIPFQIMFHTFRGIARLSLSYSTNCVTDDMAHELMERVLNVVRDMA
ncbi:unnamed protein product, partial [Meganyctiphanes norvegica]